MGYLIYVDVGGVVFSLYAVMINTPLSPRSVKVATVHRDFDMKIILIDSYDTMECIYRDYRLQILHSMVVTKNSTFLPACTLMRSEFYSRLLFALHQLFNTQWKLPYD